MTADRCVLRFNSSECNMFTVRKERIEFIVKGSKVIGHLFIPEDGKVKKYPAIFIGVISVKEQVIY